MRLIDADALIKALNLAEWFNLADFNEAVYTVRKAQPVDAVPVVRCKDCKHRPTGTNRDDLEFPDDKCPCQCEDYWYSWKPSDDWFCENGERKDGEQQ